ncbi:MAG: hypothetical protein ABIA63_01405 [bacterium]
MKIIFSLKKLKFGNMHKSSLWSLFSIAVSLAVLFCMTGFIIASTNPAAWNTGFRLDTETENVYVGSAEECNKLTNVSGNNYFIPTRTVNEYNLFITNAPFGVSETSCCTPDCVGKQCGDDGCAGSCGACDPTFSCDAGLCIGPTVWNLFGTENQWFDMYRKSTGVWTTTSIRWETLTKYYGPYINDTEFTVSGYKYFKGAYQGQSSNSYFIINYYQVGRAQLASCVSHHHTGCIGNDVYWYDSCGVLEGIKQNCTEDCTWNPSSSEYECSSCITHDYTACFDGDVYWYDSCYVREDIKEDCAGSLTCQWAAANNPVYMNGNIEYLFIRLFLWRRQ